MYAARSCVGSPWQLDFELRMPQAISQGDADSARCRTPVCPSVRRMYVATFSKYSIALINKGPRMFKRSKVKLLLYGMCFFIEIINLAGR